MKVRAYPGRAMLSYEASWAGLDQLWAAPSITTTASSFEYLPRLLLDSDREEEFLIPRPKLIVPVHTYGIRKRRTGNLHSPRTGSGEQVTSKESNQRQDTRAHHKSCPGS
ncbi:unnamed protein product [Nezara viridula]|uniref:Uncharacterized protein n=1 Tax=Nezara viridula TaxID=85310 RepID=A0A9P0HPT3_NEZVI|nr:unnamed protein product [Nezara viridula]